MVVPARNYASAVILSIAVACTLPSSDEFAAGKAEIPGSDGSVADAGKTETPADAAGSDAPAEAAAPVCPAAALFCDDFDGATVKDKWDRDYDDDNLIRRADGKIGHALSVNLGARDASKSFVAFLEQPLTLEAKKPFTVSFDLDVSLATNVGIVDIDLFRYHGPFASVGLRLASYGTGGVVHWYGDPIGSGSPVYDEVEVQPLASDAWVHVVCEVTYPTAAPHVRITYDGRDIFDAKVPVEAYVGKPYLAVGVTKTEKPGPALTVRFDNFVVTSP